MSKAERLKRKYNIDGFHDILIKEESIERAIRRSRREGEKDIKVVAFPFVIFWKRRLRNKKWVRGVFRIFEARYDLEKKKLTVVSIIQAPGIYQQFHRFYFAGRLDKMIQLPAININGDESKFICRFGVENIDRLKKPSDNLKQYIYGELNEVESNPWVDLHLYFDKSNIFYNQGFYYCDWCAKSIVSSLGIGFFGGIMHYFAFGLIYEGILTAIFAAKPMIQIAGKVFRSFKREWDEK